MKYTKNFRLVFFIPGKKIGGTNTLFEALIKEILKIEENINIAIVDYKDGYIAQSVKDINRNISVLDWSNKVNIRDNDILILDFLSAKNLIYKNINISPKAKLFLWVTHPHDIFKWLPTFNFTLKKSSLLKKIHIKLLHYNYAKRLTGFINEANKCNSINFMDSFCLEEYQSLFKIKLENPSILPVFIRENKEDENSLGLKSIVKDNFINMFWLGRVADFKTQTILNIIYDLNSFNKKANTVKIRLHLIGDGKDLDFIKNETSKIKKIDVRFYGSLPILEVRKLLANNNGIMIGHGISILEGARSKYPCIIADGMYLKSKKLLYRMLIDEEPYSVGRVIEHKNQLKGYPLEVVIYKILNSFSPGEEEFNRWGNQHSLKNITKKFITNIKKSDSFITVEVFNGYNFRSGNFIDRLAINFKSNIK